MRHRPAEVRSPFLLFVLPVVSVVSLLSLSCTVVGAQKAAQKERTGAGQIYQNREFKVSFPVPGDFEERPGDGPVVVSYVKREVAPFGARFNLTCLRIPAKFPGEGVPPDAEKEMVKEASANPGFKFLGSQRFKAGGVDAVSVGYSWVDEDAGVRVRVRSVGMSRRRVLYMFTFAADEKRFAAVSPAFEKVVLGVRWLP